MSNATYEETYRCASGQEINISKSLVAFSKNTREDIYEHIAVDLTIQRENKMELYLGHPSRVARSKRDLFTTIRDQIWPKISGWNDKFLSQGGKEMLIKSVIQAIPSYGMGVSDFLLRLLKEI
ncbi:UNVERIFIED_CONTAM: hypothetical protein Sangu_2731000 [Sesamum angustifolium]|uniref:Uncharacterized protein n=1 Tax=Sesamum angustifolium TaxID=2727405 RepID=A0AAW2IWE3_9LAMI